MVPIVSGSAWRLCREVVEPKQAKIHGFIIYFSKTLSNLLLNQPLYIPETDPTLKPYKI